MFNQNHTIAWRTTMADSELSLEYFDVSEKTGFVPEVPPLPRLGNDTFARWEEVMDKLPALIESGQLRVQIDQLPEAEFSERTLKTEREWWRAYNLLTFLSQGYIWMEGEKGLVDKIPQKLAVPWYVVSKRLDLHPVCTYANLVLQNYFLHDPQGPHSENNISTASTFTGTSDESWFFKVHVLVEIAATPGLKAMVQAHKAIARKDNKALVAELQNITSSLYGMKEAMNKMFESCDPKTFYIKMRPFYAGSKGLDAFPDGLIYEGVDSSPLQFNGGSGGESSAIYSFDIFLGVRHDSAFVGEMMGYMPSKHRQFLDALSRQPSVRDYIAGSGDTEVISSYNKAIDAFVEFRSSHIIIVTRYIVSQKKYSINSSLEDKGTGGTEFMPFLKKLRDETTSLKIV